MFNLGKIWLIWLLIFANVTFHDFADVGKTLMCVFFGINDGKHIFIILSDLSLKCCTNRSLALSQLDQSFEIGFVGLQFRSKKHVTLIGKLIDVVSEGHFNLILYSDLLSKLIILVVSLIDIFIGFFLKLLFSGLKLFELEFMYLDLFVL